MAHSPHLIVLCKHPPMRQWNLISPGLVQRQFTQSNGVLSYCLIGLWYFPKKHTVWCLFCLCGSRFHAPGSIDQKGFKIWSRPVRFDGMGAVEMRSQYKVRAASTLNLKAKEYGSLTIGLTHLTYSGANPLCGSGTSSAVISIQRSQYYRFTSGLSIIALSLVLDRYI